MLYDRNIIFSLSLPLPLSLSLAQGSALGLTQIPLKSYYVFGPLTYIYQWTASAISLSIPALDATSAKLVYASCSYRAHSDVCV